MLTAKLGGKVVTYEPTATFIVEARGAGKKVLRTKPTLLSALTTFHRLLKVKGVSAKIKTVENGRFKTLHAQSA